MQKMPARYRVAVQGWVGPKDGSQFRYFTHADKAEAFAAQQSRWSWLQQPWIVLDRLTGERYTITEDGQVGRNLGVNPDLAVAR